MKNSSRILAVGFTALVFFVQSGIANAAEIKVLCASGFRTVMDELGPKFERATNHKLVLSFANLETALKQIQGGETADLVILQREGIDTLVKDGKAGDGSVSPLARVTINMAVRKGAPKPDITSPDALKRTLLAAKSITYPDPAAGNASGIQFAKVLDRLGITKEMKGKTVLASANEMANEMQNLIASGKADLVIHQTGILLTVSGIDIVGPVPANLYQPIVFTAAITKTVKDSGASEALIDFLRNPESTKVIGAKGMEPAKK